MERRVATHGSSVLLDKTAVARKLSDRGAGASQSLGYDRLAAFGSCIGHPLCWPRKLAELV